MRAACPSSKRVTFGEPDDETRTFGFAVEIGAPEAKAAGAFVYLPDRELVGAFGWSVGGVGPWEGRTAGAQYLRLNAPVSQNGALLIFGSL